MVLVSIVIFTSIWTISFIDLFLYLPSVFLLGGSFSNEELNNLPCFCDNSFIGKSPITSIKINKTLLYSTMVFLLTPFVFEFLQGNLQSTLKLKLFLLFH